MQTIASADHPRAGHFLAAVDSLPGQAKNSQQLLVAGSRSSNPKKRSRSFLLISTIVAVLLIAVMPGKDSFWTDEAATFHYATLPTLHAWGVSMIAEKESEALMPLGMLTPWFTVRLFGTSEWAMRSVNIFWALVALIPMLLLAEELSAPWLVILFALQPFLWFYANEARPYILQIAEGAWLLLALLKFIECKGRSARWSWCFVVAGFLLCLTSLLGVIPFCAFLAVGLFVSARQSIRPSRGAWAAMALAAPFLLALAGYYLWALHRGAQSSKVWSVNLGNLAFATYELLGFQGLGPGRVALRGAARTQGGGLVSSLLVYLPGVIALGAMYCVVGIGYVRALKVPKRAQHILVLTAVVTISALGLFALAVAAHFPFWGRHLAPVLPAIVAIVAITLTSFPRKLVNTGLALLLSFILLVSSGELRLASRHRKDDYRDAVKRAQVALSSGKRVWWFADVWASRYYGLDVTVKDVNASNILIRPDAWSDRYQQAPQPDLIILSKPDIYDKTGMLRKYLITAGFHQTGEVQAFEFFEK